MSLLASPSEAGRTRHRLVIISAEGWRAFLARHPELAADPLVAGWVDRGWPLIVRRPCPDEAQGVPLGLPLPPFAGKRRISILVQEDDVVATCPPPLLADILPEVPQAWMASVERLLNSASLHAWPIRVFGALAWQSITRLTYLSPTSDLDLLLPCMSRADAQAQMTCLAKIEAIAPMRIDAELVRDDGAAVSWRELHLGKDEVLVKSMSGVSLVARAEFLDALPA